MRRRWRSPRMIGVKSANRRMRCSTRSKKRVAVVVVLGRSPAPRWRSLDDMHAGDVFGDDRDVAVLGFHHRFGRRLHLLAETQDVQRPDRQRQQRQQRHPGRERDRQHDVPADDQHDFQRGEHGGLDEGADVLQIGQGAVDELAGGDGIVKAEARRAEVCRTPPRGCRRPSSC